MALPDPDPSLSAVAVRRMSWLLRILTATAWMHLAMFLVYALVATAMVGHWPHSSSPDPKDLGLPVLHVLVVGSLTASAWTAVAWLACLPLMTVALGTRIVRKHASWYVVGVGLALLHLVYDPAGLVDWYFD